MLKLSRFFRPKVLSSSTLYNYQTSNIYKNNEPLIKSTTVIAVRKNGKLAMVADGQCTFAEKYVIKSNAHKLRRLKGGIICGFAGSVADALTLLDKIEEKIELYGHNQLMRACVAVSREWRTDRSLQQLQAQLIIANNQNLLMLSGDGNVLEPEDDVIAIGSGSLFAMSAARGILSVEESNSYSAMDIAERSMKVASDLCVYTNDKYTKEEIDFEL
mmetsp:Transcript_10348/g.15133  ORF Transcript_10348/g.15133 Transcript_10348/m.15133 type:complete len:216 (-) Transcript_10348:91-738(-)